MYKTAAQEVYEYWHGPMDKEANKALNFLRSIPGRLWHGSFPRPVPAREMAAATSKSRSAVGKDLAGFAAAKKKRVADAAVAKAKQQAARKKEMAAPAMGALDRLFPKAVPKPPAAPVNPMNQKIQELAAARQAAKAQAAMAARQQHAGIVDEALGRVAPTPAAAAPAAGQADDILSSLDRMRRDAGVHVPPAVRNFPGAPKAAPATGPKIDFMKDVPVPGRPKVKMAPKATAAGKVPPAPQVPNQAAPKADAAAAKPKAEAPKTPAAQGAEAAKQMTPEELAEAQKRWLLYGGIGAGALGLGGLGYALGRPSDSEEMHRALAAQQALRG